MTSLATAKVLLFIALALGPGDARTIFATSNSENYVFSHEDGGWSLKTKGLPSHDWVSREPQQAGMDDTDAREITRHAWHDGSFLQLSNGNRVEKQGNAAFYIIHPGAPNQKVFTILYPHD